jgi:ribosome-binding protein aMBF1 (putative translation factor)
LEDNPTELFEKSPRLQKQKKSSQANTTNSIHSKTRAAIQRDRSQSNIEKIFSKYGHDGRFLREVRKVRGYSIDKLSNETMVAEEYIQHIEENAFDQLPAELYTMNYIKRIAGVLRISDRNIVDDYMRIYHNQIR